MDAIWLKMAWNALFGLLVVRVYRALKARKTARGWMPAPPSRPREKPRPAYALYLLCLFPIGGTWRRPFRDRL
jgi:hypothetical protein